MNKSSVCILLITAVFISITYAGTGGRHPDGFPADIVKEELTGGIVVLLGCNRADIKSAMKLGDSFIVQAIDTDPGKVNNARSYIESRKKYGRVSAITLNSAHLPYADNIVNMVVCNNNNFQTAHEEIVRILTPGGIIINNGKLLPYRKPRPGTIDTWTHYLHGPDNNSVSTDTKVGPPKHIQWQGAPRWARNHDHTASLSTMVSNGRMLFYILDEGPTSSVVLPSNWKLIARDAFNGTVLWKRDIKHWITRMWPLKSGPVQLTRRLVSTDDRIYVTLGLNAPITCIDAKTGKTIHELPGTDNTTELIIKDNILLAVAKGKAIDWNTFRWNPDVVVWDNMRKASDEYAWDKNKVQKIIAVDLQKNQVVWSKKTAVVPISLAAGNDSIYYHNGREIISCALQNGKQQWSTAAGIMPKYGTQAGVRLIPRDNEIIFSAATREIKAFSVDSGKLLWQTEKPPSGHRSLKDLFVINNIVWAGATAKGNWNKPGADSGVFSGWDASSGELKESLEPDVDAVWFHHRCYPGKATVKYIMTARNGTEFIDFKNKHWNINHWFRGGCTYGIMPANGLIYNPPHDCICYPESKLYGLNALSAKSGIRENIKADTPEERLIKGPAYASLRRDNSSYTNTQFSKDWPTYRHDNERSGFTAVRISPNIKKIWTADPGGKLSSIIMADGKLFVSRIDAHQVIAINADNGKTAWKYTVGARVDSPPSFYKGMVYFGSADGYVYCLRASDGALAWRFMAAPKDVRMFSFGQLESIWPVHGSVLIQNDSLYCVAGRSMFLDNGLRMIKLNPVTGKLLSENVMDGMNPGTGESIIHDARVLSMPTAMPDILSAQNDGIYMRSQKFNFDGQRLPIKPPADNAVMEAKDQSGEDRHLFSPTGFLDDSWFHRSYWIYGKKFSGGCNFWHRNELYTPGGRMMVFNDRKIFSFGKQPEYFRWSTEVEYHLFSDSKNIETEPFGGAGTFIEVENSDSLNPAGKTISVSAWIKTDSQQGVIIARGGKSSGYSLYMKKGIPSFCICIGGKIHAVESKSAINSQWTHIRGVLDKDKNLKIYVNDALSGTAPIPELLQKEPHDSMQIGGDNGSRVNDLLANQDFSGSLDEVKVRLGAETVLHYSFNHKTADDISGKKNNGIPDNIKYTAGKKGLAALFQKSKVLKTARENRISFWNKKVPMLARGMVLTGDKLFVAGVPDVLDEAHAVRHFDSPETKEKFSMQLQSIKGKLGGVVLVVDPDSGKIIRTIATASPVVWDGMIAASSRLFLSLENGELICYQGRE